MTEPNETLVKPIVLALISAIIGVMAGNWTATSDKADAAASKERVSALEKQVSALPDSKPMMERLRRLENGLARLPGKTWLRSQFASKDAIGNFGYRIERNEADIRTTDGRVRNVIGIINRLCQINDIVCSSRNALFDRRRPWPWPQPQQPFVAARNPRPAIDLLLPPDAL